MSGGCLSDIRYCLGVIMCKQLINTPLDSSTIAYPFSPWIVQNVGVSVGCLRGVWEVPGGCLSDSGYCLGGMMCKQLINTH